MNSIPSDVQVPDNIQAAQQLVAKKDYNGALDKLLELFKELLQKPNDDLLSMGLELLNAICDKSNRIIQTALNYAIKLLDQPEDWVKLEALLILKKLYPHISDQFEEYIEKVELRLYDGDKKVRESAVGLIGIIINRSIDTRQFPELYISFSAAFKDEAWLVRARALEGALYILKSHERIPKEMLNTFRIEIMELLHDPDEEVRGLTTEALKEICVHSSFDENTQLLRRLLQSEDWEIREKVIWILGEIGGMHFQKYTSLFKLLVPMFTDEIMMIQTKVIDAFAKIGHDNEIRLLQFFIPFMSDPSEDIHQGITETIIYVSIHNTRVMIPELMALLEHSLENVRKVAGNCLVKIYMEASDRVEEEVARKFQTLDPENWRQRLTSVKLLGDLCYVLRIKSIAIWTAIMLKKWQETERDLDVIDEIINSLSKIKNVFDKIDEEIKQVEKRKKFHYDEMELMQKMPQNLRNKAEELIKSKKFNEAEIYLEEEGNQILQKIQKYENTLNESEFKRFSTDIIEDWNDVKDEILEQISDVKSFEFNSIADARSIYVEDLNAQIEEYRARIDILKAEFESVKIITQEINDVVNRGDTIKANEILNTISSIRDRIFKMEFEVGQLWLNNLEFKEFLKEITINWIDIKLEIQQFLGDIVQKINTLQDTQTISEEVSSLRKKITFEFLNQQFQNYVIQAIQSQREVLEKFTIFEEPIKKEVQRRHFREAHHILELTINNLHTNIENHNREIIKIYEDLEKINIPMYNTNEIRRYLNNWNEIKEMLLERIRSFAQQSDDHILMNEVFEYQRIMNPLPLRQLGKTMNIESDVLKERLFELIKDHRIDAEIREDLLIQPNQPKEEKILNFFRKVNILGTKVQIMIRIYNPTRFFINDISLLFQVPPSLELEVQESDLTEIAIRELEPEAFRVIQWQFKINKTTQKQYVVERFVLNISYKNPFGFVTQIHKEMEIII